MANLIDNVVFHPDIVKYTRDVILAARSDHYISPFASSNVELLCKSLALLVGKSFVSLLTVHLALSMGLHINQSELDEYIKLIVMPV